MNNSLVCTQKFTSLFSSTCMYIQWNPSKVTRTTLRLAQSVLIRGCPYFMGCFIYTQDTFGMACTVCIRVDVCTSGVSARKGYTSTVGIILCSGFTAWHDHM